MNQQESLMNLRRMLHQIPENADNEYKTSSTIISILKSYQPDELHINLNGTGIIVVFDTKKPGPTIVFRAELDGLPITEENTFSYKSKHDGYSHSCGHDGHMTMLIGLAAYVSNHKEEFNGRLLLLFQPAEENAHGAHEIMIQGFLKKYNPSYIFGLHNLPGYKQGSIIVKKNVFASASQGLIITLQGKTSHAGHPEQGINPMQAMIEIMQTLETISTSYKQKENGTFLTIIHVNLGERAFGTSPGYAKIMATFRSPDQTLLNKMTNESIESITKISNNYPISFQYEWVEVFPAIRNNSDCVDIICRAAEKEKLPVIWASKPFSWTEDFSYYLQSYPGAFFGIGSGEMQRPLHHPLYDFPDELIPIGISLYKQIIKETMKACSGEKS